MPSITSCSPRRRSMRPSPTIGCCSAGAPMAPRSSLPTCASICARVTVPRARASRLSPSPSATWKDSAPAAAARPARHPSRGERQIAGVAHRPGGDAWGCDIRPREQLRGRRAPAFAAGGGRGGRRGREPRPRGHPLAQSGACHRPLRRPPGAEPTARSHGAGVGRAARLLPLRRSRRRGRARSQGRDRRRAGSAVGPVLARARHRRGARPAAHRRRRRFRHPRRPPSAHAASSRHAATPPACRR